MPGKQVKGWEKYEARRKKGLTTNRAARVANAKREARKRDPKVRA
jgi:hypothetical protein